MPHIDDHPHRPWSLPLGIGAGRLGPLALQSAKDHHHACQVAIRCGGMTDAQIHAVDFGKLGRVLQRFWPAPGPKGHSHPHPVAGAGSDDAKDGAR